MKRALLFLFTATMATAAFAAEYPPNEITIQKGVGTKDPMVIRRTGNTGSYPVLTVNKADKVTVIQPPAVTAWVRLAIENENFTMPAERSVRFGDGVTWTEKLATTGTCSVSWFGKDPKPSVPKICEMQMTVPAVVQPGGMPVINMALVPPAAMSKPGPRVRQLSAAELAQGNFQPSPSATHGAFREACGFSHMNMDDPIVAPGVKNGSKHMHTWNGNTLGDYSSTPTSLLTSGDSTCAGGVLNRTAYWFPTLVDIRTGQPIVPISTNFYYKDGVFDVKPEEIKSFPAGLRMIAGNSTNTAPLATFSVGVECVSGGGHQPQIPSCAVGDELNMSVTFPQCWDGKNIDSPDHKSHMAYAVAGKGCPITHPVPLPEIALNVHYKVSEPNSGTFWRLSSDMYAAKESGYSMHADWFGGWDPATNDSWRGNCINARMDCHNHLLGDGRMLY